MRKFLDYLFSQRELKWLDDLMPEAARKEKEDKKKLADQDGEEKEEVRGARNVSSLGQ